MQVPPTHPHAHTHARRLRGTRAASPPSRASTSRRNPSSRSAVVGVIVLIVVVIIVVKGRKGGPGPHHELRGTPPDVQVNAKEEWVKAAYDEVPVGHSYIKYA